MSGALWRPVPQVVRDERLPAAVRIHEVGPRDGLQAEPDLVPTGVKVELCRRLVAAGNSSLEVTSFVPPRWVPQLADAAEVLAALGETPGTRRTVLVPNARGLEAALAAGVPDVAVVVSATGGFAAANLNNTVEGALERAVDVVHRARRAGVTVRGYVSMAFGDPWEGPVGGRRVTELAGALLDAGCRVVALGDTIGVATPAHVVARVEELRATGVDPDRIALHLHDTYGQGLANVHAALLAGVTEFDTSLGGLGRCPYAPGATGNLATEDLVWMLHGLGIGTGLDLDELVRASAWVAAHLGRRLPTRVGNALAPHLEPTPMTDPSRRAGG
ncbi:hydroxymethylglutaryl-CoA lyase [Kineococcus sp. SYSU DK001]|uniref:hydroxymethylglutaryl-CoA lyase n=1 Tax=Kineococcus sp. SYSU DK001 TaxID=3383122 RepID=UPI003D7DAAD2